MSSYRRMVHHPLAVGRAKQIIHKHAWQFHGAGVEEAVRDLTAFAWASQNAREGFASFLAAFEVPVELAFGDMPPVPETAHGLTVVGWRDENGCVHCPNCRPMGSTMITAADLDEFGTVLCPRCGVKL